MSRNRARHGRADIHIPAAVITTLGRVAIFGMLGSFVLVLLIVLSPRELDAVTATLVTAFMALGGNAAVALGAILATTRPTSDPQPVTVEQPANQPVPVEAQ